VEENHIHIKIGGG